MSELRVTQLYPAYSGRAKLTEFAGYRMPLYFKGIIEETLAVRNAVGLFDVSHMGRVEVTGKDATRLLNMLLTVNVEKGEEGRAMYGFMCNERGGIIDDLITYKVSEMHYIVVVNCANRLKDLEWMRKWSDKLELKIKDKTDESILIAVQGPKAVEALSEFGITNLKRFRFLVSQFIGRRLMLARTGYTGEDGFELMLDDVTHTNTEAGLSLYEMVRRRVEELGGLEAGLGARDTLRLEAGLPLHGNDISEDVTPVEAGLTRFIDTEKEYIGKEVHLRQLQRVQRRLVGLVCEGNCIPRAHYKIYSDGREVGYITSGTYSPTIKRGIAIALISADVADEKYILVDVRGSMCKAEIRQFPFYDANIFGYRRKQNVQQL